MKKILECDVVFSNLECSSYVFDISSGCEFCDFMVLVNDAVNGAIIKELKICLIDIE